MEVTENTLARVRHREPQKSSEKMEVLRSPLKRWQKDNQPTIRNTQSDRQGKVTRQKCKRSEIWRKKKQVLLII